MLSPKTIEQIKTNFPLAELTEFRGQIRVSVPPQNLHDLLEFLKVKLGFHLIIDITCVDYLYYPNAKDRFGVVYIVGQPESAVRLIVKTFINDPEPRLPTVTDLWEGANWLEREVWDMFGIRFEGHPDLRRILLPQDFQDHPLRKDYPLQGRGERHNIPVVTRDLG
ncbi:MAG: NADH-quinone oxidoreductase subunit C [Thermogutta sp.]